MGLEPLYLPEAEKALDRYNVDPNGVLWDAIVDTIAMVCEDSPDRVGRAHRVQTQGGEHLWAVRVACREPDDVFVLWQEVEHAGTRCALFQFVGRLPYGMVTSR